MGTRLDQMEDDLAVPFRGHDLPRSRLSSRRSRFDGLPSRDASKCGKVLRSSANFRRKSRLSSVSPYSVCATAAGPRTSGLKFKRCCGSLEQHIQLASLNRSTQASVHPFGGDQSQSVAPVIDFMY
jgi:hypothetical protein